MNDYSYCKFRVGHHSNMNYDEEMANVLFFATHVVADYVDSEYRAALLKWGSYKLDDTTEPGFTRITGRHATYRVCTQTWHCDRSSTLSMKLPCRHGTAVRKATRPHGPTISLKQIDAKYMSPPAPKLA